MTVLLNGVVFILLLLGAWSLVSWMWDVGVQEILVYTEGFLEGEARKLRVQVLPELHSNRLWDRLELLLYYSGVRNHIPFMSGKVWILFIFILLNSVFITACCLGRSLWKATGSAAAAGFVCMQFLTILRQNNLRRTERYLLELINVTESFSVTGEDPVAILCKCSMYLNGPIGDVLKRTELYVEKGWSSRMILEQLKVRLEHPKWQEFIHNLNVCSMYNSDYTSVFQSSRKSIQAYLTSKKERQSVKHTAQMEMVLISILGMVIVAVLGSFLEMPWKELVWGNVISKSCTVYMLGIVLVFFWKMNAYEKE